MTRWSSRFDSEISIRNNYISILKVLSNILLTSTKQDEKQEALAIKKHMEKFQFVFLLIFQCQVLQSINLTSKALQSPKIDLENAKTMLNSSLTSIENLRDNFANIKEEAIGLAKKWGITPEFEKKRHRKVRQLFDDFNADEKLQERHRTIV
ncbi:uncharacterized protein TNCT_447291 [Trichonephila clavata]|uniref:Uncharacterized protein n=1 Tax=Trichonephila clavata TaxID=2740835 RepID=A0A8X6KGG2_TRICU|nr:uncharacterized protein TNCT_447291 [Trichonephila clavata]